MSNPNVSPRVACLFACNDYQEGSGFDRLEHPNKKASELKVKLQPIGWDTKKCLNACRADLFSQRTVLLQNLQPNTIVLLHIGTHGFLSSDGQLYLAFRDSQAHDLNTCVNLYEWLQPLHDLTSSRGNGRDRIAMNNCAEVVPGCTTLVVLDCCQDFKGSDAMTSGPPSQISQLRRHDTEMVILYACHVGRQACDVSYLTDAFMEVLSDEAGASLPRILHAVRDKVLQKSHGFQQVRWEDSTGRKAFEIVLNPRQALLAVSATSIGHAINNEEFVAQEEQQPSTLVLSTNEFTDLALFCYPWALFHLSAWSVFRLCGLAQEEWSVHGAFMPCLIPTIFSFSLSLGDIDHGNLYRISHGIPSPLQNWLAFQWKIYCIGFTGCFLVTAALGQGLLNRDLPWGGKTTYVFLACLMVMSIMEPLISMWRTKVDPLKTPGWRRIVGVCAAILMTVNLVFLVCVQWLKNGHVCVVALLVVLIAALLQLWEANAGRRAEWICSMVYLFFFFSPPVISFIHFLEDLRQPVGS